MTSLAQAAARPGSTGLAIACLAVTGTLLGLSTIFAKLAAQAGLPPLTFLLWSVAGAAAILVTRAVLAGDMPALNRRTAEYFLIAALVSFAAPNLILFAAAPHVGSGFAALSLSFPPLFTYLMALTLRIEAYCPRRAIGVGLSLGGACLLAFLKLTAPEAATGWIIAVLLVPVLLAFGNIYRTIRWPGDARPEQLAPGMLVAAVLLLAGFGVTVDAELTNIGEGWWPLALIAIQAGAFALQYLLFFVLQKLGGPVLLSLMGSVAALAAVPLATLVLGEAWPSGILPAAILIATGIALVSRKNERRA